MTPQQAFDADLNRFSAMFEKAGAIRTMADGFRWIDESALPAGIVGTYQRLVQYGYANGLVR